MSRWLEGSGWQVRPFDFRVFDHLYDVRLILETAVLRRPCEMEPQPALDALREAWLAPRAQWLTDVRAVAELDETFHETLVVSRQASEQAQRQTQHARRSKAPDDTP